MTARTRENLIGLAILAIAVVAPFVVPQILAQMFFLWVMVVFALTWDITGGQMGYNSFGNVVFLGVGMYVTAVCQVAPFHDLAAYTDASGLETFSFTADQYFTGLAAGLVLAPIAAVAVAVVFGSGILGLRGHYFAIATLGLGIAAGEVAAGWDLIGAGSGMVPPQFPHEVGDNRMFFYWLVLILAVATFLFLRWLYSCRFGLAINAIRDDEDKAEAMGLRTTTYKIVAWSVAAFFLSICGGLVGNVIGFIDPREIAFAGATFGVWMVLMAILGGKGTLWGPVIGAVIFHVMQELFWTFLLGWQRVALGLLIVLIVVFFPQGILGWMRAQWPERFGHRVEEDESEAEKRKAAA